MLVLNIWQIKGYQGEKNKNKKWSGALYRNNDFAPRIEPYFVQVNASKLRHENAQLRVTQVDDSVTEQHVCDALANKFTPHEPNRPPL